MKNNSAVNRMLDVTSATSFAFDMARRVAAGNMPPVVANATLSAIRTAYAGVRLENAMLRGMSESPKAKPGRKRLPEKN